MLTVATSISAWGQVTEEIAEIYQNGEVDYIRRAVFEYDDVGNQVSVEISRLIEGTWVASGRSYSSYDEAQRVVESFSQCHRDDGWGNCGRRTTNWFSSDGRVSTRSEQEWRNGEWSNLFQYLTIYDDQGRTINHSRKFWIDGSWEYGTIISPNNHNVVLTSTLSVTRYYDSQTVSTNQVWNDGWQNNTRLVRGLDQYGERISSLYQAWNGSQWVNDRKTVFQDDFPDSDTLDVSLNFDWAQGEWVPTRRTIEFEEMADGTRIKLSEQWADSLWIPQSRSTNTYGVHGYEYGQSEVWNGTGWSPTRRGMREYDQASNILVEGNERWTGSEWQPTSIYRYAYATATSTSPDPFSYNSTLEVYPNPASTQLYVKSNYVTIGAWQIEVVDALGRIQAVYSGTSYGFDSFESLLQVDTLAPGTYFIRFKDEREVRTSRFVKL
jgi:hypothetical protein